MNPIEFKNKWMPVELKERAIAHEHFLDLCSVVGQLTPASADPKGGFFTFERASAKQSGKRGWADVWYKGKFAWEYKSPGKDLVAAYKQLLEYREALENPPLLIVSDIRTIEIHTNFTGTAKRAHTLLLQNFDNVDTVRVLRRVFTDPYSFEPGESSHVVTEMAAQKFARIADGLRARGVNEQSAGHYLMQILFCLFAKDVGVLNRQLFESLIDYGRRLPTQFHARLGPLFQSLRDGGEVFNLYAVPHVDGGLFNTIETFELTKAEVDLIGDAAQLDWSAIDPSILGTLFERSLDPGKRAQRGLHYTSRDHVERVILPVVMAPLREEWEELQALSLRTLRANAESIANTDVGDSSGLTLEREIDGFRARLANVRILDPACGSGNFLYIALEKLLALEKEVIQFDTRPLAPSRRPMVHPGQMLGLEIEPLARELAQLSLWIGYLQWRMDNGYEWTEPILAPLETIQLQDALVTETAGHASETLWPKADYIIGNPPFLGRQMQRRRLGDAYIETLRLTYRARLSRGCDLVCYFFEQARSQIENGCAKRVGLLANTTISQIDNREVLQRIKATGDIFMAWTNVPWILDGASVRIAIVGFDDGAESSKQLDGFTVESIGADLTKVGGDTPVHRLHENLAISFQGPIKVGPFDISGDVARSWLTAPLNPHGKPNSDVVKRYVNASEITRRPQDKWIVDFGTNITQGEASLYEQPFEHVLKHVKPVRERQNHSGRREYWWIHGSPAGQMRVAISQIDRVIVTPRVAKHRMFVWLAAEAYPDNRLNVFARDDDYFFGVLHSRAHEVWSLHMASRHGLGNDPTYNNTTCFETFPLPWPPGAEPVDDPRVVAIGEAAARLDELRRNWLDPEGATEAELKKRTLTNLYNQLPTWLQHANAELDRAVWAAYGWDDLIPAEVDEAAILSRLLALNLERSG